MNTPVGIRSWGVAIPRRKLANEATSKAWSRPAMPGSRSIAGHDEDALTLGVHAAFEAMRDIEPGEVDGIIFASTTAPFLEKSSAVIVAEVLGVSMHSRFLDLGASLGAGTIALATARDLVNAGSCRNVLVVAADTRTPRPGADDEFLYGHAGAALVVGEGKDAPALIEAYHRQATFQFDAWRRAEDRFFRTGDVRFARMGAYMKPMQHALDHVTAEMDWKPEDIGKVVLYSPDIKSGSGFLKKNGFDLKTQYADFASPVVGLTGAAHTPLMLCAALDRAREQERVLVLGYGDGADAFALQVQSAPPRSSFKDAVKKQFEISYNHYLRVRGLLPGDGSSDAGFSSEIMEERNKSLWYGLRAKKCPSCGGVLTLPLRRCPHCADESGLIDFPLQRTGTVFAVTHEYYFPTPEPPLGMAVVNLDGGGRLTLQVADENESLVVGDRVELVFRRLHDAGHRPNYFWKCRKLTGAEDGNGA